MQEVGGSIPPGSTTLRPSGYAWRSHARARRAKRGARRSPLGRRRAGENPRYHLSSRARPRVSGPSGYAWRSRAKPEERSVVPGVALLGEDGLERTPDTIYHPALALA